MAANPSEVPTRKPPLTAWVQRISTEEMPIFGHTVQQVVAVAEDDEAPSRQLAQVVLQDASMTARTLKLVNSPFYNPRERGISTVSHAVVVLGFNTVRNMCLSMALVDAFVSGNARERLQHELARSIHAAVQARSLARAMDDVCPEEVFIAALLYHLGDLAFWCFSGDTGDQLDTLQRQPGFRPGEAEETVLGFRLHQLTSELVREWRINELLSNTLLAPESAGARGRTVLLCHQLAVAAEQGWEKKETREALRALAALARQPETDIRRLVHTTAREAAQVATLYGASSAARVIPQPNDGLAFLQQELVADPAVGAKPDGLLQLRMLRELSSLLESKADSNLVMELVLEGIYRGIGMDRTLFALLTPDRNELAAKFLLGGGQEQLAQRFIFRVGGQPHIFSHVLEKQAALWVDTGRQPELERLLPMEVVSVTGRVPFLVAPIVVNDRSIGLFYADRGLTGRPLEAECYESFRHFAQQASLGLTLLAKRGRKESSS